MSKVRLLWLVVKRSGVSKILTGFLGVFFVCALLVLFFEPGVNTFGDACWFMFVVSTTVGLGDFTAVTTIGRVVTVVCTVSSIVVTAVVTGVVVDFFHERRQRNLDESITEFLDKLERLPELSDEELAQISDRVKRLRKR
ncbi:MAG: ion channel [Coriobacteriales bacterium]|nr:ion channel [Coriobacteriales bacterium]